MFDLLTVKPLCKSSFMLVYFLKDPLHYSKSKYLIIGCWKPCKKTCLYFWNPLGTSATASLHPKWKVGSDFIPWSCLAGVWLCEKTKIMKAECLREAFCYSFKVMLLSQRKWRSSQCIGLFDCIVSKSETEHFLESSIPVIDWWLQVYTCTSALLRHKASESLPLKLTLLTMLYLPPIRFCIIHWDSRMKDTTIKLRMGGNSIQKKKHYRHHWQSLLMLSWPEAWW